ncbi:MAG: hypothetical protein JHC20_02005, partial [Pyrobaculum sp.]|nr:hypothetical protein [Pyrobaculum sp.]
MNKNVLIGVILAAVVVGIAATALFIYKPPKGGIAITTSSSGDKAYIYLMKLEGGSSMQMRVYYIPLKDGAVYGQVVNQSATYFMVKDNGVINVLAQGQGTYQKYTYFSRLMEICTNSTVTTTVAGEQLTVTNSQCTPSAASLPTAKNFDELVMLIQGLPGPASSSGWKKAGTAQTPFGEATVYTNTTEVPIMTGLNAVLNYEKQVLQDGSVYLFKVQLAYGTQVVATLTYTLQNITTVTPELRNVINELYKDVSAKPGGGLDILKVAQKIGMSYD